MLVAKSWALSGRTAGTWAMMTVLAFCLGGCPELLQFIPTNNSQKKVTVNIQVDAEQTDTAGLIRIKDELLRRKLPATIYVTADYANRNAVLVHSLYKDGFEIALHGFYTGEQLASMTYAEQKDLLTRAMVALGGCRPCGVSQPIHGFRPQYFSQNDDTYRVLDELGLAYNSGYKSGAIPIAGHETARTPFAVPGYAFRALPFTTVSYDGQELYLCDIACAQVQKLSAAQWEEVLKQGLQESIDRQEPLVVLFHGWYTGDTTQYDYWPAFKAFLDAAQPVGTFVTSHELATRDNE